MTSGTYTVRLVKGNSPNLKNEPTWQRPAAVEAHILKLE